MNNIPVLAKEFNSTMFGSLTVISEGDTNYFIAKEVAELLGYSKTQNLTDVLDDDEFNLRSQHELNEIKGLSSTMRMFGVKPMR